MSVGVVLDLSRLLSRAGQLGPTGIDRVEVAYARHLIATAPERLSFAAMTSWGRFGPVDRQYGARLVESIAALWEGGITGTAEVARAGFRLKLSLLWRGEHALHGELRRLGDPTAYLLVSHHHLDRPASIGRLREQCGARFVCLIHDTIPIQYPEYAKPGQDERHRCRMTAAARLADAVIVNSAATRAAFQPFLDQAKRTPPMIVAPLGVSLPVTMPRPAPANRPYFVMIGNIEPRKNHLLLLNLWRQLRSELGEGTPRLILIGRRGWENENIVDMIERSRALVGFVAEEGPLADIAVLRLLAGARALLLPSFAEGYGLPLAEALSLDVPVLCSDLPAFREVGGEVPEFLDPLDGPGWRAAVLDYMCVDSPRRTAQLARLAAWHPPRWEDHFAGVDALIEEVCGTAQPR